jgi:hypothetical protein
MGPISVISKNETEILLSWSAISGVSAGNSPLTAYNLYWDNNSGVVSIKVYSGLATNFTVEGMIGGLIY